MTYRRFLSLLLLLLCCLTAAEAEADSSSLDQAGQTAALALREVSIWPEKASDLAVSLTEQAWHSLSERLALTAEDKLTPEGSARMLLQPCEESFQTLQRIMNPISIGPDGTVMLYCPSAGLLGSLRGNRLTLLEWNDERSVADRYGSRVTFSHILQDDPAQLPLDGVIWSPDGRYAAVTSHDFAWARCEGMDLFLMDMWAGDLMQLTALSPDVAAYTTVENLCFDQAGEHAYVTVFTMRPDLLSAYMESAWQLSPQMQDRSGIALVRCDLATGDMLALAFWPDVHGVPRLWEAADGSYICLVRTLDSRSRKPPQGVLRFTPGQEGWSAEYHMLPLPDSWRGRTKEASAAGSDMLSDLFIEPKGLQYAAGSGYALATGSSWGYDLLMRIDVNREMAGLDAWWYLSAQSSGHMSALTPEAPTAWRFFTECEIDAEAVLDEPMLFLTPQLSPDGQHALLCTWRTKGDWGASWLLLRLADMSLTPLEAPEELCSLVYAGRSINGSLPYVSWAEDGRLIILREDGHFGVYALQ